MSNPVGRVGAATVRRVTRTAGRLSRAVVADMESAFPWFRGLPPEQRALIGVLVHSGIDAFAGWLRRPDSRPDAALAVFAQAPGEMTRAVSLQQTVQLVQVAVTTVETRIHELAGPEPAEQQRLREAALHFSREVAFAVAKVYAEAAERRGAWDARLEALIVDALVHGELGEALSSRAAALGWTTDLPVSVLVAPSPDGGSEEVLKTVHRAAHRHQVPILSGVYEDRLVIALASDDPVKAAEQLLGHADTRPVILGPQVPSLALAGRSAAAALSGLRAAPGWPDAPSPVLADELLPERALGGDEWARAELVGRVYRPLQATTLDVLDTLASYLECTTSVEGTARALFVHPNTVRYRLRRVAEITGADPTTPRGAFILRVALTVGRVADVAG